MHEYGPWRIGVKDEMEHLGIILLALTLRAEEDQTAEKGAEAKHEPKLKGKKLF